MIDYALILQINYPNSKWSLNGYEYEGLTWLSNTDKPTKKELDFQWEEVQYIIAKNNCKSKAKELISKSDWSVLPDVNITNKSDFENYRSQLRNLIINPVEDPIFPIEPNPIWSK